MDKESKLEYRVMLFQAKDEMEAVRKAKELEDLLNNGWIIAQEISLGTSVVENRSVHTEISRQLFILCREVAPGDAEETLGVKCCVVKARAAPRDVEETSSDKKSNPRYVTEGWSGGYQISPEIMKILEDELPLNQKLYKWFEAYVSTDEEMFYESGIARLIHMVENMEYGMDE